MDAKRARLGLAGCGPAGACSDGERRAGAWARGALLGEGFEARLEPHWVRPDWRVSLVLHGALALAGTVLSALGAPLPGLVILSIAALSLLGELSGRARLLRLLLPARATQNLVAPAPSAPVEAAESRTRLIVYAQLDAPRTTEVWFPPAAIWAATVILTMLAGLRVDGRSGAAVAVAQFAGSVVVLIGVAAVLETAHAVPLEHSPAAAVALELFGELRQSSLAGLNVELVLGGAGDGQGLGLERYIESRRWPTESVAVLSLEHAGAVAAGWRVRDGQLVALRMHPRLLVLMAHAAAGEAQLGARARAAWGCSGAYVTRRAGWPSIAVEGSDPEAMLELCLAWVGLLDAELAALA